MKIYTYFISYTIYNNSYLGEGNITISLINKINSQEQIEYVKETIIKHLKKKCKNINIKNINIIYIYLLNEEDVGHYVQ